MAEKDLISIIIVAFIGSIIALIITGLSALIFWGTIMAINGAYIGIFLVSIAFGLLMGDAISAGVTGGVAGLITGLIEPHMLGWVAGEPSFIITYVMGSHTIFLIILGVIISAGVSIFFASEA